MAGTLTPLTGFDSDDGPGSLGWSDSGFDLPDPAPTAQAAHVPRGMSSGSRAAGRSQSRQSDRRRRLPEGSDAYSLAVATRWWPSISYTWSDGSAPTLRKSRGAAGVSEPARMASRAARSRQSVWMRHWLCPRSSSVRRRPLGRGPAASSWKLATSSGSRSASTVALTSVRICLDNGLTSDSQATGDGQVSRVELVRSRRRVSALDGSRCRTDRPIGCGVKTR